MRTIVPEPKWSETEQRWRMDATRDGERKVFVSRKEGRTGAAECRRKYEAWKESRCDKSGWRMFKCWADYLSDVEAKNGKNDSYLQRDLYGRLYILPALNMRRVGTISEQDWQNVISSAKPVGRKFKDRMVKKDALSKKTLMNLRDSIMNFCKYAKKAHMIAAIPDDLYIPSRAKSMEKTILQPDQLKILFEQGDDRWYINAWRLMALTGLRPGEVFGLKKTDIRSGSLTVRRSINKHGEITTGKNDNARREMVLHEYAAKVIKGQEEKLRGNHMISPWIFPARTGEQASQSASYDEWKRFATPLGIMCSPYSLRHTFISLAKNDIPEERVKSLVGHSKTMDTFGVYGHTVSGEKQETANMLTDLFSRWLG